jgi:hypothetical protein
MLQNSGQKAVTPQMLRKFAATARDRIRLESGGYRRDHLRALAQRVEVAEGEVRIMGSKSRLLQTLVAGSGVNSVPTQGLKWRRKRGKSPVKDQQAIAELLAKLGQSRLSSNLNQLARLANMGALPVTPETETAIIEAAEDVAAMRKLLIEALGMEVTP